MLAYKKATCPATECSRDADVGGFAGTQGGIESRTKLFGIGSGWHQLRRNLSSIGCDGLDMSNEGLLRRRCVMGFLSGSIMLRGVEVDLNWRGMSQLREALRIGISLKR